MSYVSLLEQTKIENNYDQANIQALCIGQYAIHYDWVLAIDADEFVWFNRTITQQHTQFGNNNIKSFLQSYHSSYHFLSLGKWEYSTHFIVENSNINDNKLFGIASNSFTAKAYCVKSPRPMNNTGCPGWPGRSKFFVKPTQIAKDRQGVVHGRIRDQPGALFIPAQIAHIKEFYGKLITPKYIEQHSPKSFQVNSTEYERVGIPQLDRAYDLFTTNNGTNATVMMHYDDTLLDWLLYVEQLPMPSSSMATKITNSTTNTTATIDTQSGVVH